MQRLVTHASSSDTLLWVYSTQGCGQQAGRPARPAIVGAVQRREVLASEQLVAMLRKKAVEGVLPYVVAIHCVGLEQTSLWTTRSERCLPPLGRHLT